MLLDKGPSYKPVQSVQRVLSLLMELNRHGVSPVLELHRKTGLPKPTIVRMLETLMAEGFVFKDKRQGGYMVTEQVMSLSCGFHGEPMVVGAARPWASAITRQIQWPVSLAMLDAHELVVRLSTVCDSPISPEHATINMRLSLIEKAMGLTYLANCNSAERDALLRMVEDTQPGLIVSIGGRGVLDFRLKKIRRQGYALRAPNVPPLNSSTLAVPVMLGGRVLATMGLGFFRRAVSQDQLLEEYLPLMRNAACAISEQVALLTNESSDNIVPFAEQGSG